MNERFQKLFDHVAYEVMASGGDGCGIVVFRQTPIQDVAKAFEEWRAASAYSWWLPHRIDHNPNHVLFTDRSNENISFVSKADEETWVPHERGGAWNEVWLEVW